MTTPDTSPKSGSSLYLQVLAAIALGILVGWARPEWGMALKPLGDGFVKLIKLLIAPIVFTTVVAGISGMGNLRKVGRVGGKALLWFELMTTVALILGFLVVHVIRPGDGMHKRVDTLDTTKLEKTLSAEKPGGFVEHVLGIIPDSFVGAFVSSDVLQVLLLAVLSGIALAGMGDRAKALISLFDQIASLFFGIIGIVMRLAPVGAFGAMAFTIGTYGVEALANLAGLLVAFYITALLFVFVVLGGVLRVMGFSIFQLVKYLRSELVLVLGTSSSESALPGLMNKLERLGCGPTVVRLVVPTGYSFNLDGTCIYLTMAAGFVAQALDVPLTLGQEVSLLLVLLLTSKGAAGVTGSGFITLAATLRATGTVPVEGLSLLLGIDRFMSEGRALTNIVGNAVATMVVSKWENELDAEQAHQVLEAPILPS